MSPFLLGNSSISTKHNFIESMNTNSVDTDSLGNIYVVGGGVLVKLDAAGNYVWSKQYTDSTNYSGYGDLFIDSSDNIFICGQLGNDGIVTKIDNTGSVVFHKTFTLSGYSLFIYSINVDSTGNIYIAGDKIDNITANEDFFLAKLDSTGAITWQRTLTTANAEFGYGVLVDASGNVYATGSSGDASSFFKALVVKYSSSGVIQWQRTLGVTSKVGFSLSVSLDASANVYINLNNSTDSTNTVAKYNTSGVLQWQRTLSTTGSTYGMVSLDGSANVYAVCSQGDSNVVLVKYNTSGTIQWQRVLTYSIGTSSYSLGTGKTKFSSTSGDILIPTSNALVKIPNDGTKNDGVLHTYNAGTTSFTYSTSTLTDAAGANTNAASTLTNAAGTFTLSTPTLTSLPASPSSTQVLMPIY